nr:molybdenum cofactor guanylyltransferase [Paenibacillus phyllosphaerae]
MINEQARPITRRRHALLLAGGQSARMGSDKAMLALGGKPLLVVLAERLTALGFTYLIVAVGAGEREAIYDEALSGSSATARTIQAVDQFPGCGPLAGLHAGLAQAPDGYVFVIACDMPALSAGLLGRMLAEADRVEAESSSSGSGIQPDVIRVPDQPFHALYHTRIVPQLAQSLASGELRVMRLLNELPTSWVELEEGEQSAFDNLNTPEAFARFAAQWTNC